MEISNAIIISAIIISFAAITITITLVFKKKTLSLILFLIFSLSIVVTMFYKEDIPTIFKGKTSNNYKSENLGYKNMTNSPTLRDAIFTFGSNYFINADSSIALFKADDFFNEYDYKDCIKESTINLDCFDKDLVTSGNLVLLRNKQVIFIGGNNHTRYYNKTYIQMENRGYSKVERRKHKNYYNWSLDRLIKVFGNYNQVWSSSDNTKRIYRFDDSYFFLKEDKVYFYGQSFSDDFNVLKHQLLVLNDRYREIK